MVVDTVGLAIMNGGWLFSGWWCGRSAHATRLWAVLANHRTNHRVVTPCLHCCAIGDLTARCLLRACMVVFTLGLSISGQSRKPSRRGRRRRATLAARLRAVLLHHRTDHRVVATLLHGSTVGNHTVRCLLCPCMVVDTVGLAIMNGGWLFSGWWCGRSAHATRLWAVLANHRTNHRVVTPCCHSCAIGDLTARCLLHACMVVFTFGLTVMIRESSWRWRCICW